jgi:uncharacterized protein
MKFVLYRDSKREWRWRLIARNGRNVASSGEGYKRRGAALTAIHRVRDASNAPIMVVTS